jgi:hypothetical protein
VVPAEGCLEARAFLAAEQQALTLMDAIYRSFLGFSDRITAASVFRSRRSKLQDASRPTRRLNRIVGFVPVLAQSRPAASAGFGRVVTAGPAPSRSR